jgi:hypothetical protein
MATPIRHTPQIEGGESLKIRKEMLKSLTNRFSIAEIEQIKSEIENMKRCGTFLSSISRVAR